MADNNLDFELIRDFLSGNVSAFNKIVIKYRQNIYWHARRMTGNHFDADEILQEVLIVLYNKLKDFQFKSSLYTWIYRITSTRSINFIKRKKIKNIFSLDEYSNEPNKNYDIITNIEQKEELKILDKELQKIPPKQREIFIMRNFDELSYEEISEITGTSIGGLKANYFHAVNKITELMKK